MSLSQPGDVGVPSLSPVRTESAGEPKMTTTNQLIKQRLPWSDAPSQHHQCMPTPNMRFTNYR